MKTQAGLRRAENGAEFYSLRPGDTCAHPRVMTRDKSKGEEVTELLRCRNRTIWVCWACGDRIVGPPILPVGDPDAGLHESAVRVFLPLDDVPHRIDVLAGQSPLLEVGAGRERFIVEGDDVVALARLGRDFVADTVFGAGPLGLHRPPRGTLPTPRINGGEKPMNTPLIYPGIHQPSMAGGIPRCMISVNRLLHHRSDFPAQDWILDSGAFTGASIREHIS